MSSAIYTGIVKHNPLEGGFWELETDGGASYQLRGIDVKTLIHGARFEVHGRVEEGGMGIGMSGGSFLDVVRVQKLLQFRGTFEYLCRKLYESDMQAEIAKKHLEIVTQTLSALRAKVNLIEDIGWPRETEEQFFSAGAERLPEPPEVRVDRDALEGEIKEIQTVISTIVGDGPIPVWLRSVLQGAIDRDRLLLAAGTKAFGTISKEVYGGAGSTFYGLSIRNYDLAEHILHRLKVHGWDAATDKEEEPLSAEAFAEELRRRIAKHRPAIRVDVALDSQISAKAIAGMSRLRIRSDATFSSWEADGLFCHEVETHVFTAQNGAAQPFAPFLKAGGPRTTATQEGLAVFSELYSHAMAIPRLERLAIRVKLVHMAEEGASFLDLYRFLLDRDQTPREAYLDAARVCRGGMVTGGAPFTKDSCYLAGLVHVYAFLSIFVRGGFRDEVELLVAGRIAMDDILALVHLQAMGLLERPRHRPRWLRRWNTLLPFFTFSSFLDEIHMRQVAMHYEDVIKLAASIQGPQNHLALIQRQIDNSLSTTVGRALLAAPPDPTSDVSLFD